MKKYLLILLFPLVLSLASCGDNNVASSKEVLSQVNTALKTTNYVTYIQTRGDLSYEINSDTPFTGYYLQTYTNGEKDVITHYKDGMKNGPSAYWYENGQKKRVRVYKNGMKDGPFKSWYENGQKKTEGILINGKVDGYYRMWYENGQISSAWKYKNGKEDGTSSNWYENGQLRNEIVYKDGKKDSI